MQLVFTLAPSTYLTLRDRDREFEGLDGIVAGFPGFPGFPRSSEYPYP
jgi:hypothetical protein